MPLGINEHGIVDSRDRDRITICRPNLCGGPAASIGIDSKIAKSARLETGDIVEGAVEQITSVKPTRSSDVRAGNGAGGAHPRDVRSIPTDHLVTLTRINGMDPIAAAKRPTPRETRNIYERVRPNRRITIAQGARDETGRAIDFAAPLGMGCAGVIHGPHGSGLSQALMHLVRGFLLSAPDIQPIVLLLRPRGEEITHWRRLFPDLDVVVCPSGQSGSTPEQTLSVADLTLEAALRQTELGRHILLAVDTLTGLWGAMLESEEADAQREADIAAARHRIRVWFQKAGDFTGEGLFGTGLGGSLTLIGTAWGRGIDIEAEEEGETHPHLRLLEHVLPESNWALALAGELAAARHYPAIDLARSLSRDEENLMNPALSAKLIAARLHLKELPLTKQYDRLMSAIAAAESEGELLDILSTGAKPREASYESIRSLLGGDD